MPRSLAIVAAALALVSTAAMPLGAASAARRGSLTITVLGRDGLPVSTQAQAISLRTNATFYIRAGHTRALPLDTYVVVVDIENRRDGTSTVGARKVTVSGDRQVTFRARLGKPVRARLRPIAPAHYTQSFQFSTCVRGTPALSGFAPRGHLFVLPDSIPELAFALSATWAPAGEEASDPRYLGAALHRHGIPDGVARTFRQAALVPIRVIARRGPLGGQQLIQLDANPRGTCLGSVRALSTSATLPSVFTAYVPPARWSASELGQDFVAGPDRPYHLGHHYRLTLNRAVWGPNGPLPYSYYGRRLVLNTSDMFIDSVLSTYGAYANVSYRLTHAGQTLVRTRLLGSQPRTVAARLPERGWYTLIEDARRPADRLFPQPLSPRAELRLHFHDGFEPRQEVRGYITRFRPLALDVRNSAPAGSRTTVPLDLVRRSAGSDYRLPADRVRSVSAWWSGNRGQTWHRVPIVRRDGHRAMIVPNPTAGAVSLRATVIDVHGNSTRTTVIDGYAVR